MMQALGEAGEVGGRLAVLDLSAMGKLSETDSASLGGCESLSAFSALRTRTTVDRIGMYINALNREAANQGHSGSATCESGELASKEKLFVEFEKVSGHGPCSHHPPQPIVSRLLRPWSSPRYQGPSEALQERSRKGTTWVP